MMKHCKSKWTLLILMLTVLMMAIGCGGMKPKPFEYESANEIPSGPGLLTGKPGEYTLYDSNKRKTDKQPAETGITSTSESLTPTDSEEFRRFQQWQQEKEEFEEFQEWKRSSEGREAYDEFLEWKRWQSFKRWQESQSKSE